MSKQTDEELTEITKKIQHMGGLVESALDKSLSALLDRDARLAREVIESDSIVDNIPMISARFTIIGETAFGNTCKNITRALPAPVHRAAST